MTKTVGTNGPVNGSEIINNLIRGAEGACKEYIGLSGNPFPGSAPESFVQAGAARGLKKLVPTCVVLEEPVARTYKAAQPPKRGPLNKNVARGRYDITVYWKNGNPRAAVEVKSPVNALSKAKYLKDFNRLIQTMRGHKAATFQYGIFLFLTVKKNERSNFNQAISQIDALTEKLKNRADDLCKPSIRAVKYDGESHEICHENIKGAWRISAIVFRR